MMTIVSPNAEQAPSHRQNVKGPSVGAEFYKQRHLTFLDVVGCPFPKREHLS